MFKFKINKKINLIGIKNLDKKQVH